MTQPTLYPDLQHSIQRIQATTLAIEREEKTTGLAKLIHHARSSGDVSLLFVCTHNSRRSQMAQAWAQALSWYFGLNIPCYTGGMEVTTFHTAARAALVYAGFRITKDQGNFNLWQLRYSGNAEPVQLYSKLVDDPHNPKQHFIAVMTCSDADENCPVVPGSLHRFALNYNDPRVADNTPQQEEAYRRCSEQIAGEMFTLFGKVSSYGESET